MSSAMATLLGALFWGARKEKRLLFGELFERRSILTKINLFAYRVKHFRASIALLQYHDCLKIALFELYLLAQLSYTFHFSVQIVFDILDHV